MYLLKLMSDMMHEAIKIIITAYGTYMLIRGHGLYYSIRKLIIVAGCSRYMLYHAFQGSMQNTRGNV